MYTLVLLFLRSEVVFAVAGSLPSSGSREAVTRDSLQLSVGPLLNLNSCNSEPFQIIPKRGVGGPSQDPKDNRKVQEQKQLATPHHKRCTQAPSSLVNFGF